MAARCADDSFPPGRRWRAWATSVNQIVAPVSDETPVVHDEDERCAEGGFAADSDEKFLGQGDGLNGAATSVRPLQAQ